MKATTPTLHIELNVSCPKCGNYIDLLSVDLGINDEGEILKQAIPKGHWTDEHPKFSEVITCPDCWEKFLCEGIDW